jgi:S-formylglutathione hydrolase FrmB
MLRVIFAAWIAVAPALSHRPGQAHAQSHAPVQHAFHDDSLQSTALGRVVAYRVLLPEGYDRTAKRFPVLYLLHGLDGHYDDWSTRTELAERVRRLPLIVVMPEGGDSWYTNAADGSGRFEDYIVDDLVHDVETKYRVIRARYGRAIAGLSMGGYGAVKIGLKHPGLFQAAGSLSGAFDATDPPFAASFPSHTDEMGRIFGAPGGDTRRENDVFLLAERANPATAPAIYVGCGESDRFLASNRRLVEILQRRSLAYEYHETPGGHTWDYWDRGIAAVLPWMMREFRTVDR